MCTNVCASVCVCVTNAHCVIRVQCLLLCLCVIALIYDNMLRNEPEFDYAIVVVLLVLLAPRDPASPVSASLCFGSRVRVRVVIMGVG